MQKNGKQIRFYRKNILWHLVVRVSFLAREREYRILPQLSTVTVRNSMFARQERNFQCNMKPLGSRKISNRNLLKLLQYSESFVLGAWSWAYRPHVYSWHIPKWSWWKVKPKKNSRSRSRAKNETFTVFYRRLKELVFDPKSLKLNFLIWIVISRFLCPKNILNQKKGLIKTNF